MRFRDVILGNKPINFKLNGIRHMFDGYYVKNMELIYDKNISSIIKLYEENPEVEIIEE